MSLLNSIENLQQAPLRKKKIVLAITVFIIMIAVISLWMLQLQYTLSPSHSENASSVTEPLKLIWASVRESLNSSKQQ